MVAAEEERDMDYKTEQEAFWSGEVGDCYIERNGCTEDFLASAIGLFAKVLGRMDPIGSVIEFGSNIGNNLKAVKTLVPSIRAAAIEINHKAASRLREDAFWGGGIKVFEESILEFEPTEKYDMSLISGVLIHINPNELQNVYEKLYLSSRRYIYIAEYYSPTPVEVPYRGHEGKLFKRDFAGEFLDKYPDCRLVDYGFQYHRDNYFPGDDGTWFLMEKIR